MEKQTIKVGWIGTGVMGFSMCKHLLNAKYDLTVFNRTAAKADGLLKLGAKWAEPLQIAKSSDVLFLMLGFPKDLEDTCLGQEGIIKHMKAGAILVDHTTSKPKLAETIFQECLKYKVGSVDAPVSGGDVGAKEGRLVTMCGGQEEVWSRVKPIMQKYSQKVILNGGPGKGQHTKMTNQIAIAGSMAGTVQALMYASKAKLDLTTTLDTITLGAANSFSLSVLGRRIVDQNYDPGFYVEHYIKDLEICLQECAKMDLALPCLALVRQLYGALKAQGGGRLGTQGLIKVLENLNNHKIGKVVEKNALVKKDRKQPELKYLLVLDFEATCIQDAKLEPCSQIIEFPVMVVNLKTLKVEDTFHQYVKPRFNPELTKFCTELTGITQEMVNKGKHIEEVLVDFGNWLNGLKHLEEGNYTFITCGEWDLSTCLKKQAKEKGLKVENYLQRYINIKKYFVKATSMEKKIGGMMQMIKLLGIQHEGRHHSGIDDVKNICNICIELAREYGADYSKSEITKVKN